MPAAYKTRLDWPGSRPDADAVWVVYSTHQEVSLSLPEHVPPLSAAHMRVERAPRDAPRQEQASKATEASRQSDRLVISPRNCTRAGAHLREARVANSCDTVEGLMSGLCLLTCVSRHAVLAMQAGFRWPLLAMLSGSQRYGSPVSLCLRELERPFAFILVLCQGCQTALTMPLRPRFAGFRHRSQLWHWWWAHAVFVRRRGSFAERIWVYLQRC